MKLFKINYTIIRNINKSLKNTIFLIFSRHQGHDFFVKQRSWSGYLKRFMPRLVASLGIFLTILAGYLLTYSLFFNNLNISKMGQASGGKPMDFRYDGVAYFHGTALLTHSNWELSYFAPRILGLADGKLEFFVEVPQVKINRSNEQIGNLVVFHREKKNKDEEIIPIYANHLQRFKVDWQPKLQHNNNLVVRYRAKEDYKESTIHFAAVVSDIDLFLPTLLTLGLGVTSILISTQWNGRRERGVMMKRTLVLLLITGVAFYAHSGAFISQEFFTQSDNRVISGMARQLDHLLEHGFFRETNYRGAGAAILPLGTYLVEGNRLALQRFFQDIYPTSGYLAFVLFTGSILFLGDTLWRLEGRAIGITFMVLAVTFFPFIADLYSPDADAMLLFLFPFFTAFLLRTCYGIGYTWSNWTGMLLTFFIMGLTKVTPIFLAIVAPTIVLFPFKFSRARKIVLTYAVMSFMLTAVFVAGVKTSDILEHPERNVGIEGEAFQDTVIWHMLWAANGVFDHHSAHGFTKSARLRNERVSQATGLPPDETYIRHAKSATDELYKPAWIQAFKERPGYFYSTAFLRFYNHGLRFFRYTYGGDSSGVWQPWLKDGFQTSANGVESELISEEEVFKLTQERKAIRYSEAWKVSPLVLNAKITQGDMTRLTDLVLLVLAFAGMLSVRYRGFAVFLILCALAQIVFASFVHGINRYFMFCSTALLIGLAISLCSMTKIILSRETFKK
jgi:hypothetical protein